MSQTRFSSACGVTAPDTLSFPCPEAGNSFAIPKEPHEAPFLFFLTRGSKRAELPYDRGPARLPTHRSGGNGAVTPRLRINGPVVEFGRHARLSSGWSSDRAGSSPAWPISFKPPWWNWSDTAASKAAALRHLGSNPSGGTPGNSEHKARRDCLCISAEPVPLPTH